ncbi:MAG: tetraacyldisaccharide 4'-kinase, partial [Nitrospinaceae bacterium]|nr:tetraacyldisaccharide 4'-kinase [Nitrospinaceae bacterium]NIR54527.1 tetraacyldisaccharide 4'-kinase [Nitrospinaceae bacterium]NIS84946.1 tetraacyldisaccharide 4'-kinase [Nitrospinaceae bacterium]NIT81760.1 tetraacyldisaccharide 4'-kinase [Nitrospinaceae bacterium]NIU44029.1 tetraacyldisaccharide 4'-kinase [Nitrospinaceae bacterium]
MSLEPFFHEVIAPGRPFYLQPVYGLLRLVSAGYAAAQSVRSRLYRKKLLSTRRLECRVISIGNLTLGGTGKSPMVILVADALRRAGFKPAVLSRGYGGNSARAVNVVCDGQQVLLSPEIAGDEPVMIARRLKDVPVLTGKDRYATGQYAIEQWGVDTLILDDGFQHLALHRDLNILLCDQRRPFGNGVVFPAGELREPLSALKRADLICLTRCGDTGDSEPVAALNSRGVPVIQSGMSVVSLVDLKSGQEADIEVIRNQPVAAFSGIAHPDDFFDTLERIPVRLVSRNAYPDHHDYSSSELQTLASRARQSEAGALVTTEKDAVKLAGHAFDLPVYAVRIAP